MRSGLTILLLCTVLLGFVWVDAFYKIEAERQAEIENAINQTAELALSFEEQTLSTIRRADQLLLLIKSQYERDQQSTNVFQLIKLAGLDATPIVLLSVADEKGDLLLSNQEPFAFSNIHDREHFQVHARSADKGLFISNPVLGRSSGKWSIQLTRRINQVNGAFGGVTVSSLSPFYFTDFYRQINLGNDSVMALIKTGGMVESWETNASSMIGMDLRQVDNQLMERLLENDAGYFYGITQFDGIKRIYSYRTLRDYSLIVLVGMSEKSALADFDQMRRKFLLSATLVTIITMIACMILVLVATSRQRAAKLQKALYAISETASSAKNMMELYESVHRIVSDLLPAQNFYIALYDEVNNRLHFCYRVDKHNKLPETAQFSNGLTEYIIRSGEAIRIDLKTMITLKELGQITEPKVWFTYLIGTPLKNSNGEILGAMAAFTISKQHRYTSKDQAMLNFVSDQIAMAIERKGMEDEVAKSQERYELAMEATSEGLWDYDLVKDEFYYSDRLAELIGIVPGQKLTIEEFGKVAVSSRDRRRMHIASRGIIEGKTPYYCFEYRKNHRWLFVRGKAIYNDTGRPIRVVGSTVDITERKKMELELKRKNKELDSLNEQIQRDLQYASKVQLDALPDPFTGEMVRVKSVYLPYHIVSGDFLNYQWLENRKQLRGYIVDVSGHGMAPALQTATLKMLLDNKLLSGKDIDESDFQEINRSMISYLFEESFAGLIYFEFDFQSFMLKTISAGIQLFLKAKTNKCELVSVFSGYLGMFDKAEIQTLSIPFRPGDIYCMMSDGMSDLVEMHGINKQKGYVEYMTWIKKLTQHHDRSDDFSAICLEILQNQSTNIIYIETQDELAKAQQEMSRILQQIVPQSAAMVEVAINEAINNGLRAGQRVRVKIKKFGQKVVIRVKDEGPGFNTREVNTLLKAAMTDDQVAAKFDEINLAESGRGILMMKMICNQVLYNKAGNEVLLMVKCN